MKKLFMSVMLLAAGAAAASADVEAGVQGMLQQNGNAILLQDGRMMSVFKSQDVAVQAAQALWAATGNDNRVARVYSVLSHGDVVGYIAITQAR